jgi:chromosome segregation ATPase
MIDQQLARLRTHRNNIRRYHTLLQTNLTELERQFVQRRLTEEQSNLERLATSLPHDLRGS